MVRRNIFDILDNMELDIDEEINKIENLLFNKNLFNLDSIINQFVNYKIQKKVYKIIC